MILPQIRINIEGLSEEFFLMVRNKIDKGKVLSSEYLKKLLIALLVHHDTAQ